MSRQHVADIRQTWNEKPAGPHAICTACDLFIGMADDETARCPVPEHARTFVVRCWGFRFGIGTSRAPCLGCTTSPERALAYAKRFRDPKVQGTGGAQ